MRISTSTRTVSFVFFLQLIANSESLRVAISARKGRAFTSISKYPVECALLTRRECTSHEHSSASRSLQSDFGRTFFHSIFMRLRTAYSNMKTSIRFSIALVMVLLSMSRPASSSAASGSNFSGSSFSTESSGRSRDRQDSSRSTRSYETPRQSTPSRTATRDDYFTERQRPQQTFQRSSFSTTPSSSSTLTGFSRSSISPAIKGISLLTAFVALSQVPFRVRGKLGFDSAATYEVQMAFRLNNSELQSLLLAVSKVLSSQTESLESRVNNFCLTFLRCGDNLVGGRMVEYRDVSSKRTAMEEIFHSIIVKERVKYEEGDDKKGAARSKDASTMMIVTIALLSVGPVLRNRGWSFARNKGYNLFSAQSETNMMNEHEGLARKKLLKRQDIERFLFTLPPYVRSQKERQLQHEEQVADGMEVREDTKPGYSINLIWTPSKAEEVISESEFKLKWPSIQYF